MDALHYFRAVRALSLSAQTTSDILVHAQNNLTVLELDGVLRAAGLVDNVFNNQNNSIEDSSITVRIYTSGSGLIEATLEYSKSFQCPSPIPVYKIDEFVSDGGNAIVSSACMT